MNSQSRFRDVKVRALPQGLAREPTFGDLPQESGP